MSQAWLSALLESHVVCENRTSTPRIRKINRVQAIPVGMGTHMAGTELLLVLSGQISHHHCTSEQMEGGLGSWKCNLGDIFSSAAAGDFAPKKGFLDTPKLSLLKALPNHATDGGGLLGGSRSQCLSIKLAIFNFNPC